MGGTISGDVDVKLASSYEGSILESERSKKQNFDSAWSHTWVQPLIGMHANYTLSDDWQAFVYLDAAGFGLSGREDLSGVAQAGVAYTIGNSTQLSLLQIFRAQLPRRWQRQRIRRETAWSERRTAHLFE